MGARGSERDTKVSFEGKPLQVAAHIRAEVAKGRAVCWIRNTVADVLDAADLLTDLGPLVFHARFLEGDRARIEAEVIERSGPSSGANQRRGLLVIASQVIEQSIDADFDVLITDLAPMDLIIQRAGRLHRHVRDAEGNRSMTESRPAPVLVVHAPEWTEAPAENWFASPFPRAAYVYPHHDRLWLTQRALREAGAIRVPSASRDLIESVYGDRAVATPSTLERRSARAVKEARERRSRAMLMGLNLAGGYRSDRAWESEERATTRDGPPSRDIHLVAKRNGSLYPLGETWASSRLSVRASSIGSTPDHVLRDAVPDRCEWSAIVEVTEEEAGWQGGSRDASGRPVKVTYSPHKGLHIQGGKE